MVTRKSERGQALILIVFAILGMVGLTALAVDGGNAYSNRRQAQNTADAAALAAALAKSKNENLTNAGISRAVSNGFNNDGTTNSVVIHNPPTSGPYAGNSQYIQVIITSYVDTYFGSVVGINSVTNEVQAVARVVPPVAGAMYPGFAVVGLAPSGCNAVYVAGNGQIQTWGGGLYSNSTDTCGMHFQGSSQTQTHEGSGGINMVANAYQVTGNPSIQTHGEGSHGNLPQLPYPPTNLPNPQCSGTATKSGSSMTPGNYSGTFPPSGVQTLQSGVYCLSGSFKMNANDKLTGNNVVIVLEVGGSLDWNGSSEIKLSAPTSGPFKGLLIFSRLGNPNTHPKMHINGNSNSKLTGTIYLPSVELIINGNNTQLQKTDSQIIAYTVEFSGSSDTQIEMNANHQYQPSSDPTIELVQ